MVSFTRFLIKNWHEVLAAGARVFLDLHAEVAVPLHYTIEPMEQHPQIFAACDRIWIDLILDVRLPLRRAYDYIIFPKIVR